MTHALVELKELVLQKASLQDLVARFYKLEKRGSNYATCCPFHGEKTPSFYLFEQRFFCFGCKISGDVIDFVRQREGVDFKGALIYLADLYGISIPPVLLGASSGYSDNGSQATNTWIQNQENSSDKKWAVDRTRAFRLMQAASLFFQDELSHSHSGVAAANYFLSRGFSQSFQQEHGVGFAPGQGLINHLRKLGAKDDEIIALSLGGKRASDQSVFDFFRNRLMIPISDQWGRVIAFGGRTLEKDQEPKYLNSKETLFFKKGKILFGLAYAKPYIREKKEIIIVEGYMDALKLWHLGLKNCVAVLGTALTEDHLRAIKPLCSKVYILFDGDGAGFKASMAAARLAIGFGHFDMRVGSLPRGEDPDTFVTSQGVDALKDVLAKAQAAEEYLFEQLLKDDQNLNSSSMPMLEIIKSDIFPWLAVSLDPLKKGYLLARLSEKTGIKLSDLELGLKNQEIHNAQARSFKNAQQNFAGVASQGKTPIIKENPRDIPPASAGQNPSNISGGAGRFTPSALSQSRVGPERGSKTYPQANASLQRGGEEIASIQKNLPKPKYKLTQSEIEILGHLLYLSPTEKHEREQIRAWRQGNLGLLPGNWGNLCDAWMLKLDSHISPLDDPFALAELKEDEEILSFIERLLSMKKAFPQEGRRKRLERLFIADQVRELKKELSRLKGRLDPAQRSSSQEEEQILMQMGILSKRIGEAMRQLSSLK